jgi:hypothetical protein
MPLTVNTSNIRAKIAQENSTLEKLKNSLAIGVFSGSRASVESKIASCQQTIKKLTQELESSAKQIHKVYHIEFFEGKKKHFYFGSQAAIYDMFTPDQVGITLAYLRNHVDLAAGPYENKKCIIRLGKINRRHTLRGRKT